MEEKRIQQILGVTRLARVTGLDRTGVEVACAIRPGGHVLQVSNGKGERFADAARGALLEASELWAAERVEPATIVHGSLAELRPSHGSRVIDPLQLSPGSSTEAHELYSDRTRLGWRVARDLTSGEAVFVPASAVHCPPPGSPFIGPALARWTSNGMGAHPSRRAALLHALLEAAERDQLARSLPEGWTEREISLRLIEPLSLSAVAPRAAEWKQRLERRGFSVYLFDLSPPPNSHPMKTSHPRSSPERGDLGLPVAAAMLVDGEDGPIPLTAGYACALHAEGALLAAILEAAQSRITDIHGAREDVQSADPAADETLAGWCRRARPRRRAAKMGRPPAHVVDPVHLVLGRLRSAGHRRVAAIDLAPPGLGLHVFKVVIPGLLVSELL